MFAPDLRPPLRSALMLLATLDSSLSLNAQDLRQQVIGSAPTPASQPTSAPANSGELVPGFKPARVFFTTELPPISRILDLGCPVLLGISSGDLKDFKRISKSLKEVTGNRENIPTLLIIIDPKPDKELIPRLEGMTRRDRMKQCPFPVAYASDGAALFAWLKTSNEKATNHLLFIFPRENNPQIQLFDPRGSRESSKIGREISQHLRSGEVACSTFDQAADNSTESDSSLAIDPNELANQWLGVIDTIEQEKLSAAVLEKLDCLGISLPQDVIEEYREEVDAAQAVVALNMITQLEQQFGDPRADQGIATIAWSGLTKHLPDITEDGTLTSELTYALNVLGKFMNEPGIEEDSIRSLHSFLSGKRNNESVILESVAFMRPHLEEVLCSSEISPRSRATARGILALADPETPEVLDLFINNTRGEHVNIHKLEELAPGFRQQCYEAGSVSEFKKIFNSIPGSTSTNPGLQQAAIWSAGTFMLLQYEDDKRIMNIGNVILSATDDKSFNSYAAQSTLAEVLLGYYEAGAFPNEKEDEVLRKIQGITSQWLDADYHNYLLRLRLEEVLKARGER